MNESQKYCRSLHALISLGTTSDDRLMPYGYEKAFAGMSSLILTEKLDGQNVCFKKDGVYARSHTAPTNHPWDKPMRERWELIKNDLGNLELFGESMYGIHSIEYSKLESYYYLFAVRENGIWKSWEEVKFYAALFNFPTVPEIEIRVPLKEFYKEGIDGSRQLQEWFHLNLGVMWEESVETPGLLGGFDPVTGKACSEGFVVRNADSFETNGGILPVADNEFNNLFKIVRKKHVKTDVHWTKNWRPAKLIDYTKYSWHSYEFMNVKNKEEVLDFPCAQDIGKIVRYKGEKGVVIKTPTELVEHIGEICVRWDNNKKSDYEGYYGMQCTFIEDYELKYINIDGTLKNAHN